MVRLETGTGEPVPHHREARLPAIMEQMLLRRLEAEQEDRLEWVEAAVEGEAAPVEVPQASVDV